MPKGEIKAYLVIHFLHGYIRKRHCEDPKTTVGGLLGGHIEWEIEDTVYGFQYADRKKIHFYSRKQPAAFGGLFTRKSKANWLKETKNDRITSIFIPLGEGQRVRLVDILEAYHRQAPYDYAFLGMRCASATFELMAEIGLLPKKSRRYYILHAFYPRQLRKRLVKWAKKNKFQVLKKEGIESRFWE